MAPVNVYFHTLLPTTVITEAQGITKSNDLVRQMATASDSGHQTTYKAFISGKYFSLQLLLHS